MTRRGWCYQPSMSSWQSLRDGTDLAVLDYGGDGAPVVLLRDA